MKKGRNLLALLLALLLPLGALGEIAKEEVIYAKLALDGQVQEMYVVNSFEADAEAAITDYGAYTRRISLTDSRLLPEGGDEAALSLTPGRYYYQGNGLQKEIPWIISLTGTLNGEPIPVQQLANASGEIALTLSVQNNPKAQPVTGFTLQISLTLDGDICHKIKAPGGMIALMGGNRQVTYAIMPGMEAQYTLTFTAENFAMGGLQIGGVRMEMDADMYADLFTKTMEEPMATMARNMAKGAIANMNGGPLTSFADPRNEVTQVQFVFVTDPIAPPAAPKEAPEEAADAPQNFWQRLGALFGL